MLLIGLLTAYLTGFLTLAFAQRSFMYHPDTGDEKSFLALAGQHKLLPWRDSAGQLIGWKRVGNVPAKNRMLILHGNGGSALARTYFMDGLAGGQSETWDFYCLEYPGYGSRLGSPTETSILAAGNDAMSDLLIQDARPLFITGESLGTGVACILASKYPDKVKGIFLVTPYTSTVDVAVGRFPIFPVRLVMQDKYEAEAALKNYSGPVAFLLAGQDYVVPTRFGQALHDSYSGPKKLWIQGSAGHNTLDFNPHAAWWKEVDNFLLKGAS